MNVKSPESADVGKVESATGEWAYMVHRLVRLRSAGEQRPPWLSLTPRMRDRWNQAAADVTRGMWA